MTTNNNQNQNQNDHDVYYAWSDQNYPLNLEMLKNSSHHENIIDILTDMQFSMGDMIADMHSEDASEEGARPKHKIFCLEDGAIKILLDDGNLMVLKPEWRPILYTKKRPIDEINLESPHHYTMDTDKVQ